MKEAQQVDNNKVIHDAVRDAVEAYAFDLKNALKANKMDPRYELRRDLMVGGLVDRIGYFETIKVLETLNQKLADIQDRLYKKYVHGRGK